MKMTAPRKFNRAHVLPLLAFALTGLSTSADSNASAFFFYKFTPIADSLPGFPYSSLDPFPSINSSGRIAFSGTLTGGVAGVFTRLGTGGVNTLATSDPQGFSDFGIETSINSLNMVSFSAIRIHNPDPIITTILRGEGNSSTKLLSDASSDPNHLTDFCGIQINNEGSVAFRAERSNGKHEIRAHGAGQLNGVFRIIAEEGSEFSDLHCAPSIAHDGTVAFGATRDFRRAIFTRTESGTLTRMIADTDGFTSFSDLALNQFGGLAFTASLAGFGGQGAFRLKDGFLSTLMTTNQPNPDGRPVAVSINESGTVAFGLSRDANGSSVHLGPNSVFGRIVGIGNLVFNGRLVRDAMIGGGAINSTGQVVVSLGFFDGSVVIARGDPVNLLNDIVFTGAMVLTAASDGGVDVGTNPPAPPKGAVLTFDLTFLSSGGQLDVKLGTKVVQSIRASEVGVRKVVSVPLDPALTKGGLQFSLSGKKGSGVQIGAVTVPGISSKPLSMEELASWKVDESRGGVASFTNTARYPAKIQLTKTGAQDPKTGLTPVSAAVLSDEGVDASADLMLSTLRVAGIATKKCTTGDVNGDKLKDLVCDVALTDAALKARTVSLEAMTQSGWGIEGAAAVGAAGVTK